MSFLERIPRVNIQALIALMLFALTLFIAHIVAKIAKGELTGNIVIVFYLRVLLGFVFAASIALAIYSFMGICVLFN